MLFKISQNLKYTYGQVHPKFQPIQRHTSHSGAHTILQPAKLWQNALARFWTTFMIIICILIKFCNPQNSWGPEISIAEVV